MLALAVQCPVEEEEEEEEGGTRSLTKKGEPIDWFGVGWTIESLLCW